MVPRLRARYFGSEACRRLRSLVGGPTWAPGPLGVLVAKRGADQPLPPAPYDEACTTTREKLLRSRSKKEAHPPITVKRGRKVQERNT